MYQKLKFLLCFLALMLTPLIINCYSQPNQPVKGTIANPPMDQKALDILKQMSKKISKAKNVSFQVKSLIPVKNSNNIWVNLYNSSNVVMQAPNKLYIEVSGDFAAHNFYYDGKNIISYSPTKNSYWEKTAPETIDKLIDDHFAEYGNSFPYADILLSDPYSTLTKNLVKAFYIGHSIIANTQTDHLAFVNKYVEWQIWIDSKSNLPVLVSATYLNEMNEPSYEVAFSNWKLNQPIDSKTFSFVNNNKAKKIESPNNKNTSRKTSNNSAADKK